jgi:hypothetical protein
MSNVFLCKKSNVSILSKSLLSFGFAFVLIFEANAQQVSVGSLEQAVFEALGNDPWFQGNQNRMNATLAKSVSSSTLPDPKLTAGLGNLPMDDFSFDREGMTQLKVGISQMFPRGNSLDLKSDKFKILSGKYPVLADGRRAKVTEVVSKLWLDIYKLDKTIRLIEADRPLFEQLVGVAEANYSSARGKTRQQDVIRAQLEITRLEDRIVKLKQMQEFKREELLEWFSPGQNSSNQNHAINSELRQPKRLKLKSGPSNSETDNVLHQYFFNHPSVRAISVEEQASQADVEIERQSYKPAWGISGSYAYRADSPAGDDRADLLSVGVTIDIPLFTSNKQDQNVKAAVLKREALKTDKYLLVRNLAARYLKSLANLKRLDDRKKLYDETLLAQMDEQVEASLTAYTNDDGDFAEVVRSKISQLNALIERLDIEVESQKQIITANYLLTKDGRDILVFEEKLMEIEK